MRRFATALVVTAAFGMQGAKAAMGQEWLIPPAYYAVQGAPFTAEIEAEWEGTAGEAAGKRVTREIRDAAGRQRFESPSAEEAAVTGQPLKVLILDVSKQRVIRLDAENKVAQVSRMRAGEPIELDLRAVPADVGRVSPGGTYLGMRTVAGLDAWGQHLDAVYRKRDGSMVRTVREIWLSTTYRMPVMEMRMDAQLGKLTSQVIRFEAGAPDEGLFEIPAGYRVVGAVVTRPESKR